MRTTVHVCHVLCSTDRLHGWMVGLYTAPHDLPLPKHQPDEILQIRLRLSPEKLTNTILVFIKLILF